MEWLNPHFSEKFGDWHAKISAAKCVEILISILAIYFPCILAVREISHRTPLPSRFSHMFHDCCINVKQISETSFVQVFPSSSHLVPISHLVPKPGWWFGTCFVFPYQNSSFQVTHIFQSIGQPPTRYIDYP